jgi:hypothetical protein
MRQENHEMLVRIDIVPLTEENGRHAPDRTDRRFDSLELPHVFVPSANALLRG